MGKPVAKPTEGQETLKALALYNLINRVLFKNNGVPPTFKKGQLEFLLSLVKRHGQRYYLGTEVRTFYSNLETLESHMMKLIDIGFTNEEIAIGYLRPKFHIENTKTLFKLEEKYDKTAYELLQDFGFSKKRIMQVVGQPGANKTIGKFVNNYKLLTDAKSDRERIIRIMRSELNKTAPNVNLEKHIIELKQLTSPASASAAPLADIPQTPTSHAANSQTLFNNPAPSTQGLLQAHHQPTEEPLAQQQQKELEAAAFALTQLQQWPQQPQQQQKELEAAAFALTQLKQPQQRHDNAEKSTKSDGNRFKPY